MDTKLLIFERILYEFNWGQRKPHNRIVKLEDFNPTEEDIKTTGNITDFIAKYINWIAGVAQTDKANKTAILSTQPAVNKRQIWLKAMFERLTNERPNHPALIVLAKDMHKMVQNAQQDCI